MTKIPTILVAIEKAGTSEMIRQSLLKEGVECVCVGTASDALELNKKQRFDLYILDASLPDASGFDLCRQLKTETQETPIIIFDGRSTRSDTAEKRISGETILVVKLAVEEMMPTVRRLLNSRGGLSSLIASGGEFG
jgi:DNA-binding response OmpR family regulator